MNLHQELTQIAQAFAIFECVDCANQLREFLTAKGVPGRQIELFSGSIQDPFCNIYHDDMGCNISINGRHVGVQVSLNDKNLVFDNLKPQGIPREEWFSSFYCPIQDLGGSFQVTEINF